MPAWEQLTLEGVHANGTSIVIRARSKRKPRCPACAGSAVSYHSQYERRLRDLPCLGQPVQLRLRLRRFRCRNRECPQKIFAERLPAIAAPRARETCRMGEMLGVTGYVLGGLPAHRLLQCWGIGISRETILRRVKSQSRVIPTPKVRVLGVDDWAWRKRQHYGTMLMNLESRRVIDLLPVRSASSFADWLRHPPEIEIITRDRSTPLRRWRPARRAHSGAGAGSLPSGEEPVGGNGAGCTTDADRGTRSTAPAGGIAKRQAQASYTDRGAAAAMPGGSLSAIPGCDKPAKARRYATGHRRQGRNPAGDGGALVTCRRFSRTSHPK